MTTERPLKRWSFRRLAEHLTCLHDVVEARREAGDDKNARLIELRSIAVIKDEIRARSELPTKGISDEADVHRETSSGRARRPA